ncbi:Hint domain-containing protein [Phaeovulum vinaykumarii]|uniref:Hemolysin-type calcium-binding repeat-containing protein n=1 Tax=Phaeovulum vinaykumarii TaxID=407234 RepID=A0A1N7MH23_9RHOB|nr:Hint domain-containing protein [Phaeovulum vinaykumarii]SIS85338.1 Hemolysin-type calcium-binding repeat-containing protein [Phaeovulum vinaykumarii]SOC12207.1 hemolysin type calcium-binding protein [Phaeovulum vinaykumarii]
MYRYSDFTVEDGGPGVLGSRFMLDPAWSAVNDRLNIALSDDDPVFDGSYAWQQDGNQMATVTTASGGFVASGAVRLTAMRTVVNPAGGVINLYEVHVNGTLIGHVSDVELTPGVTYEIINYVDVTDAVEPQYSGLVTPIYDPTLANSIIGGGFADSILGNAGADSIWAGAGNDTIDGGAGADVIVGGAGNDTIYFGTGGATQAEGDTVYGGTGDDLIDDVFAGHYLYDAVLYGDAGNDSIWGGYGNDSIYGGDDNDFLNGELGDDLLDGGTGNDLLRADGGNDSLLGGDGTDTLEGGDGADTLEGGTGSDLITIGAGDDLIVFSDGHGADTVSDFDTTMSAGFTADQLDVTGMTDTGGQPVNAWDVTVTNDGLGNSLLTFPGGETLLLTGVVLDPAKPAPMLYAMGIPCFVTGTRIATPEGPRRVETLRAGDRVLAADAQGRVAARPIVFAAARWLGPAQLARRPEMAPVEIDEGALGLHGRLCLSRQHSVLVGQPGRPGRTGRLARAGHLADLGLPGVRLRPAGVGVGYHHILLDRHALVSAEGLGAETLWPGPMAFGALSGADRLALLSARPDLAPALLGQVPVESLYGPMVRPLLKRREISAQRFVNWRDWGQEWSFLAALTGEFVLQ